MKDINKTSAQLLSSMMLKESCAELMLEYPHEEFFQWGNGTMVMLGVDSDEELVYWRNKIRKDKTVPYQLYFEHHNKDGHLGPTAMAVLGNENTKEILKDLKLL